MIFKLKDFKEPLIFNAALLFMRSSASFLCHIFAGDCLLSSFNLDSGKLAALLKPKTPNWRKKLYIFSAKTHRLLLLISFLRIFIVCGVHTWSVGYCLHKYSCVCSSLRLSWSKRERGPKMRKAHKEKIAWFSLFDHVKVKHFFGRASCSLTIGQVLKSASNHWPLRFLDQEKNTFSVCKALNLRFNIDLTVLSSSHRNTHIKSHRVLKFGIKLANSVHY